MIACLVLAVLAGGLVTLTVRAPDPVPPAPPEGISPLEAAARPFLGEDEARLRARLGPPAFRLAEPPGEYWRYDVAPCELDLFLYPSGSDGMTVQHARYRPSTPTTPPEACLPLTAQLELGTAAGDG